MTGNQWLAEFDGNPVFHGNLRSQGVEIRRVDFQVIAIEGLATGMGQPGPEKPAQYLGKGGDRAPECNDPT